MQVKRVISNNAVLATRDAEEVVVLGRGVGFGVRAADAVDAGRIEQVFLAEGSSPEKLSLMLADIPSACLRAADRIAELARERLGVRATQSLILPLADHLAFAVRRAEAGETLEYPLLWEVSHLYPREYDVGRHAVALATQDLGVQLDQDEAVAIAMHLVNSQFTGPGHSTAVVMTETIARIVTVIEQTFSITIDRHSMACTRFVTHLRYVFARVASDKQIVEPHPTLFDAISTAHPEAMRCSVKVQYLIEVALNTSLTLDETAYLGLHIARLLAEKAEPLDAQP